jgi:hypothetical protein
LHEQPLEHWLLDQPIADEIKAGLKTGTLTLGLPEVIDKLTLAPYFVKSLGYLPPVFHNMGAGYFQTPSHELLVSKGSLDHPVRLNSGKILISWNECPEHHPYCTTGAMIGIEPRDSKYRVEVLVIGDSMSQTSPWITPRWNQSWQYPYLDVTCGERTRHFLIAKSIGYDRTYGFSSPNYAFYLANEAMLTPFKRIVTVDCRPTSLTLGRKFSRIDYIQSFEDLPGQATTVDL